MPLLNETIGHQASLDIKLRKGMLKTFHLTRNDALASRLCKTKQERVFQWAVSFKVDISKDDFPQLYFRDWLNT